MTLPLYFQYLCDAICSQIYDSHRTFITSAWLSSIYHFKPPTDECGACRIGHYPVNSRIVPVYSHVFLYITEASCMGLSKSLGSPESGEERIARVVVR